MEFDSVEHVQSLTPLEINITRRLDYGRGALRYAEMRMQDADGLVQAIEKGEVVLRRTPKGARSIKAKFYEIDRGVYQLTFQYFTVVSQRLGSGCR